MSLDKELKKIEETVGTAISQVKNAKSLAVDVIPSGSYSVDYALGVGGLPRGRIIEMFGQPSGGKTTLALLAIAEAQKQGGKAAFIDVEYAFNPAWAKKLGVDVDNLIIAQPEVGEKALELIKHLTERNLVDIIVLDSTAALVPKESLDHEIGEGRLAPQSRMMSDGLRRLTPFVGKSKAVVIFINQTRTNPMATYGNPTTTPGGQSLKFYSSIRINVNRKGGTDIKEQGVIIGHDVRINVVKNKVAPPYREAQFTLRFDAGIDHYSEILSLAKEKEIINLRGSIYEYKKQSWKGANAVIEALKADPALKDAILDEILRGKTNEESK